MSGGVLSQLDAYYSWIDEAQNPIDPDEVAALIDSPVRELPIPAPVDPRRPWLVAVAAAAAVLVLVGGAALLFRVTGPDAPVADTVLPTTLTESTPTTTTAEATTTTTAEATTTTVADPAPTTPPLAPLPFAWSRVPSDEAVFGGPGDQGMEDVVVAGPGFVAVGGDRDDAAVWTSVDGITWSRVAHDDGVFGEAHMFSVTAGGPVIVAVGFSDVWTSPDGISWTRGADDENVFGDVRMDDVTVGGPGFVAVGTAFSDGGQDAPEDAAVWTSVDGVEWSRVAHDESIFGGPDNQSMHGVTVGGPGLVAVGYDGTHGWDNPNGDAAVWTSVDGITWSRVPHDVAAFGARNTAMVDVTAGGPGLVAVGYGSGCRPVWTSVDGLVWSRVPDDVPGACRPPMRRVIVDGSRLVAVGHGGASWESVDGVTWTQIPDAPASPRNESHNMVSVTSGDSGLIAVGSDYHVVGHDGDGIVVEPGDAVVWTAATED